MSFFFVTLVPSACGLSFVTSLFPLNFQVTQLDKYSQFSYPRRQRRKRKGSDAEDTGHCSSGALRTLGTVVPTPRLHRRTSCRPRPAGAIAGSVPALICKCPQLSSFRPPGTGPRRQVLVSRRLSLGAWLLAASGAWPFPPDLGS